MECFSLVSLLSSHLYQHLEQRRLLAQAMTVILENLNGVAAIGIGIGLTTLVGQCIGAGRKDEAEYYIKKLMFYGEIALIASVHWHMS